MQAMRTMNRKTVFSEDRIYRYVLWREWDMLNSAYAMFIGLNPSTADETQDDPTIRRCIGFAKEWGFGSLCMTNLFAFRATKPEDMKKSVDPVGQDNDYWLKECGSNAGRIIAAWGTHGCFMNRDYSIMTTVKNLKCLGKTKTGFPKHPLYLKKNCRVENYSL